MDANIKFADHPNDYYGNLVSLFDDVQPKLHISARIYKGISLCLDHAKKDGADEFIHFWESHLADQILNVYEGKKNYLYQFTSGDIGGGYVCFIEKNSLELVRAEPQY